MAKRPTIGENPLDAVMADTPLESVFPGAGPQAGRPSEEPAPEVKKRLAALEAEVKALKGEISLLKGKVLEMQVRMPPPEPRWVTRLREKLAGK
ncbi:MAG: hypothetical protein ACYDIC_11275 [Desulfobaccales bacterium]